MRLCKTYDPINKYKNALITLLWEYNGERCRAHKTAHVEKMQIAGNECRLMCACKHALEI